MSQGPYGQAGELKTQYYVLVIAWTSLAVHAVIYVYTDTDVNTSARARTLARTHNRTHIRTHTHTHTHTPVSYTHLRAHETG